ncbi:aminotransferase class I/II-fold pyridoxal phosphate-dependent enzyme [Litoribacter alkaliphilus]|uniref:Aminotransferase class I/II-fold pyridoxal phosphate-dependent enzyme n=1 Tax=Litoribacter ruber TaxID=702568 RepID=A0AAP2CGE3_9BACT|nr:aminotransferase class I/II-fold pyridoxal phosphate-dependent enzyme [Litoribacter alkaliphilus]MBS9523315.1 aminotransferase class I/II-fold pyridoxal phosphate-dependent enzyme [Litoribacter alkaliphilus]
MIPLSTPYLAGNEWQYVKECLDTGWISSSGDFVGKFEEAIGQIVGCAHTVACVNGTVGLQMALQVGGLNPGEHVLIPNLTFVATANAVHHAGGKPILIDVDKDFWQMDLDLLEDFLASQTFQIEDETGISTYYLITKKRIAFLMPVHVLGYMGDMDRLAKIAEKYHLKIVEDSTEALGSTYKGQHAGTFGDFGVFSFNGNKIISTGGGGMVVCKNPADAAKLKHLINQAKSHSEEYTHDETGYNFRMVNVLAAIGLAQAEQFSSHLSRKKEIAEAYRVGLKDVTEISFQRISPKVDSNDWLFTILLENPAGLQAFLQKQGIQTRKLWVPMNQLPMHSTLHYISGKDQSDLLYKKALSLPCSVGITESQIIHVIGKIKEFLGVNHF